MRKTKDNSAKDDNYYIRIFVGDNYEYYQKKWNSLDKRRGKFSFNLAAFFFLTIWLAYRKMYRTLIIYLAIVFGLLLITFILNGSILSIIPLLMWILLIPYLSLVIAFRANHMYRELVLKKISQIKAEHKSKDVEGVLAEEGGTCISSAALMGILVFCLITRSVLNTVRL